jgi:hypothetical protein
MSHAPLALVLATFATSASAAERLRVDPDVGNSTLSAVFDAALGERIVAQSSSVSCDVTWDEKAGTASGACSVPLTGLVVDNEPTKTGHFREWTTNRRSDPAACRLEARFQGVKLGALAAEKPVPFAADVPFTVCGRGPTDGRRERLAGTVVLLPAGTYGDAKTLRVRATVEAFDREAYRIGPGFTDGWLAKVQSLAKVVAKDGRIDLNLFAVSQGPATAAARP